MCLSPALPSGEDLVRHQLELQQILHEVHQRYAGRRGRYNKHDTARLRFIKDTAFPGVRFGKKVQERDMAMLRLPPTSELGGAALAEMDEWSRRHAPDPRSSNQGEVARLDEEQQSTLLRWAATQANGGCVADHAARRGAPPAYRLHFGAYKGLGQAWTSSTCGLRGDSATTTPVGWQTRRVSQPAHLVHIQFQKTRRHSTIGAAGWQLECGGRCRADGGAARGRLLRGLPHSSSSHSVSSHHAFTPSRSQHMFTAPALS